MFTQIKFIFLYVLMVLCMIATFVCIELTSLRKYAEKQLHG